MNLATLHRASDELIERGNRPRSPGPINRISVGVLAKSPACMRYPVLDRIMGDLAEPFNDNARRVMAMGKEQEAMASAWLHKLGVSFTSSQVEVCEHGVQFPVTGYYDFDLEDRSVVEMKTVDGNVFRTYVLPLTDGASVAASDYWLFPQYYRQLQAYLWLADRQQGWFLFWRRDALEFRFVPVARDEECIADLQERSRVIREHCLQAMRAYMDTGDAMAPEVFDALPVHPPLSEFPPCGRCPMRHTCAPGKRYVLQSSVVDDSALEQLLMTVEEHEEQAKAKKTAWDSARDRMNDYWDENAPDAKTFTLEFPAWQMKMVGSRSKTGSRTWRRKEMEA